MSARGKMGLAALMLALGALGGAEMQPAKRDGKPPRKFTDQRKAEAEAKRQRKNAKRRQQHGDRHEPKAP